MYTLKNVFKNTNFIKVEYAKIQSNLVYLKPMQYVNNKETKFLLLIIFTNLTITKIQF